MVSFKCCFVGTFGHSEQNKLLPVSKLKRIVEMCKFKFVQLCLECLQSAQHKTCRLLWQIILTHPDKNHSWRLWQTDPRCFTPRATLRCTAAETQRQQCRKITDTSYSIHMYWHAEESVTIVCFLFLIRIFLSHFVISCFCSNFEILGLFVRSLLILMNDRWKSSQRGKRKAILSQFTIPLQKYTGAFKTYLVFTF